jgi:hypothetical protein
MNARTPHDEPFGPLSCSADPDAWDIPAAEDRADYDVIRRRVVAALQACGACPARSWCERQTFAQPPGHPCVQAGHIWPGAGAHKNRRKKIRTNQPVPYDEWRPRMTAQNHPAWRE